MTVTRHVGKYWIWMVVALLLGWQGSADAQRRGKRKAEDKSAWTDAITDPNPGKAAAAAAALGEQKSGDALDRLLDALATGLHPQVAAEALKSVAKHGKPVAFDTLEAYLNHRNAKVRTEALRALGQLPAGRTNELVLGRLGDSHKSVRAAAATLVAERKLKKGIEPLIALLKKGDEGASPALASLADADLARVLGELINQAPDALLSRTLGEILMRPDFKPEEARVELVKTLGKIPGNESVEQLTNYVGSIPAEPPRESRAEAEAIIEARLGGD